MLGDDGGFGFGAELLQVHGPVRRPQVQEPVPYPRPLGGAGLGGADVHVCVDLARVHRQHGQVQGLGDGNRQVGFAAAGGPEEGDHQGGIGAEARIRRGGAGFGTEDGGHRPTLPGAGTGTGLHP